MKFKTNKEYYSNYPFPNYDITSKDKFKKYCEKHKWYLRTIPEEIIGMAKHFKLKLLDAGCGTGENSCMFANMGFDVTGFDISKTSIDIAKNNAERLNLNINFIEGNINNFKSKEKFDVIFCMGVIMCSDNLPEAFANLASMLNKNGTIVIGLYNKYGSIRGRLAIKKKLQKLYGEDTEKKLQYLFDRNPELNAMSNKVELTLDGLNVPHEKFSTVEDVLEWFSSNNIKPVLASPPIRIRDYISRRNPATYSSKDKGLIAQLIWYIMKKDFFVLSGRKNG